jgi:PhnB protein
MNIPSGYGTMFPYLFVEKADQYLAFLKDAFGAQELGLTKMPDGTIANARVRIGNTSFMFSEAGERIQKSSSSFYLYVENADVAFERAVSRGARAIMPPADQCYGDRQGGVIDPSGNIWWISQRLSAEPYEPG